MLDPPSPLVRQITMDKWEEGEARLRNKKITSVVVNTTDTYIYRVVRDSLGRIWRETTHNGVTTRKQSF